MLALLTGSAPVAVLAHTDGNYTLTILHTNDLHSHIDPFMERGRSRGGIARIAHLTRSLRSKNANTLVLDAGDIFQGTTFFKIYRGETDVDALNLLGCDAYTIGNHEFDEGVSNLARQLKRARFDIVSANLDLAGAPELAALVRPSTVKSVGGQKVGIVGAMTPDLVKMSMGTGPVAVKQGGEGDDSWIKPIADEVAKLDAQGVDKIILLTHVGVDLDRKLAEAIPQADAIVGGHTHTRLSKPIEVKRADGSRALIVQTGSYGRALGRLDLSFDPAGRLVPGRCRYALIDIGPSIPEDSAVRAYIDSKSAPVRALRDKVAGLALTDFDNRFARYRGDSPIGDLVCDAIAAYSTEYGATIAMQNRGGIRARIDRGMVTMEKVEEVLPFDNTITYATISGTTLRQAVEHGLSGSLGAHFLDVSGLKVAYDPDGKPGQRAVFILARGADGSFTEIDAKASYKIAVNNFTFSGGEGFDFSPAAAVVETKTRLATALASYLMRREKVRASPPERILPVTTGRIKTTVSPDGRYLLVSPPPGSWRLTLVVGDGPGIESLAGQAVPLAGARIVASAYAPGRAAPELRFAIGKGRAAMPRPTWAAVIASPQRAGAAPLVSAPVRLSP